MEFWEGAVLIIGGVWLVGRMSRGSLPKAYSSKSAIGTVGPLGNTVATNTDGSSNLIAGEPLTPIARPLIVNHQLNVSPVTAAPIRTPILTRPPLLPMRPQRYLL